MEASRTEDFIDLLRCFWFFPILILGFQWKSRTDKFVDLLWCFRFLFLLFGLCFLVSIDGYVLGVLGNEDDLNLSVLGVIWPWLLHENKITINIGRKASKDLCLSV